MGVVQGIHGAGQILPPDAEPSGIVPRAEVGIQNDSIYAVVAAGQQIPVQFTQSVCHTQKIQVPSLRVQLLSSSTPDSCCPKGHFFAAQSAKKRRPLWPPQREFCSRNTGRSGGHDGAGYQGQSRRRSPCLVSLGAGI